MTFSIVPGWTADDVPDLTGKRAVVTGATSGLGEATAVELARHGAHVVLTARDAARGEQAAARVRAAAPDASVEVGALDLADLSSVRAFAAGVVDRQGREPLDLLVNNAGVMAVPARRTVDGFELQIATNHLGPFALTGLLLPALLRRPGARVVTVSSFVHRFGSLRLGDLMSEQSYDPWQAYYRSKLANLLFMRELGRRAEVAGVDLVSAAAHPGWARTNLQYVGPRTTGRRGGVALARTANAVLGPERDGRCPAAAARGHRPGGAQRRLLRPARPGRAARAAPQGGDEPRRPRRPGRPLAVGGLGAAHRGAVRAAAAGVGRPGSGVDVDVEARHLAEAQPGVEPGRAVVVGVEPGQVGTLVAGPADQVHGERGADAAPSVLGEHAHAEDARRCARRRRSRGRRSRRRPPRPRRSRPRAEAVGAQHRPRVVGGRAELLVERGGVDAGVDVQVRRAGRPDQHPAGSAGSRRSAVASAMARLVSSLRPYGHAMP